MTPARRFNFIAPQPSPLVRFEGRGGGREVALIGVIEVGQLAPSHPFAAFCWRIWLPGCPQQLGRAASPESARSNMIAKIEQWIEAAGLIAAGRAA